MKKYIGSFWADLKAETPKLYNWLCGVLFSLGGSAGAVAVAYSNLPATWQTVIPQSVITGLAVVSLLGSAVAKKQNIK